VHANTVLSRKVSQQLLNCGIDKFELLPEESDMSETVYRVNWTRYEYTKIRVKSKDIKKLCLVKKSTSPGEMFNYFKEILIFLRTVKVVILEYCMSINYGHM
jgi:hypothetical protein